MSDKNVEAGDKNVEAGRVPDKRRRSSIPELSENLTGE
jgi:hypothetical protein